MNISDNINSIVSLIYDNWMSVIFVIVILILYYLYKNSSKLNGFFPSFSASGTPILDNFSRDLTKMAKIGTLDPVIGREEEVQRLIQILSRRTKNNVVLVGKPGIGKTAIAEGLAEMIINKKVPELLYDKRVLALDLNSIAIRVSRDARVSQRRFAKANRLFFCYQILPRFNLGRMFLYYYAYY